uniref:Uncharacterized protein n=1 Tax=Aplanochytrium stocchinoi TaxID=215587 RepID=A0A7S3LRD2_9STRA
MAEGDDGGVMTVQELINYLPSLLSDKDLYSLRRTSKEIFNLVEVCFEARLKIMFPFYEKLRHLLKLERLKASCLYASLTQGIVSNLLDSRPFVDKGRSFETLKSDEGDDCKNVILVFMILGSEQKCVFSCVESVHSLYRGFPRERKEWSEYPKVFSVDMAGQPTHGQAKLNVNSPDKVDSNVLNSDLCRQTILYSYLKSAGFTFKVVVYHVANDNVNNSKDIKLASCCVLLSDSSHIHPTLVEDNDNEFQSWEMEGAFHFTQVKGPEFFLCPEENRRQLPHFAAHLKFGLKLFWNYRSSEIEKLVRTYLQMSQLDSFENYEMKIRNDEGMYCEEVEKAITTLYFNGKTIPFPDEVSFEILLWNKCPSSCPKTATKIFAFDGRDFSRILPWRYWTI